MTITLSEKRLPTKVDGTLAGLPDLILGGAVFNYIYKSDPENIPATAMVDEAFSKGMSAIDTSAYYGPSEVILGGVLDKLKEKWPRESYYICTKAGRVSQDVFDYTKEGIRASVERSLNVLHTTYADVVYIHDVEFKKPEEILEAVTTLHELRKEGKVHYVGISGYPVEFLAKMCEMLRDEGVPVDIVLSYSNMCLQNTLLLDSLDRFKLAGVQKVLNGSPLSMSLLRSQPTHSFHPAPESLKKAVAKVVEYTKSQNVEFADLALRYAYAKFPGGTVVGVSTVEELQAALDNYWLAKSESVSDQQMFDEVKSLYGDQWNLTWTSGNVAGDV